MTKITPYSLSHLFDASPADIEGVLDAAFGQDRRKRTAYQVRRGMDWMTQLSFMAANDDGMIIGLVQCWPVALYADDGGAHDLIMVGPVAVHPDYQGRGIGICLMDRTIAEAQTSAFANTPMMMIGDYDYYKRWHFNAAMTGQWRLNGPFDPARLLARGAERFGGALAGEIGPRR